MEGSEVFKSAVRTMSDAIAEALRRANLKTEDIDCLIPHQANLRISQFVQRRLGLRDDQVWNNIQKYGNTTAASIPIALTEAMEAGKIKEGDFISMREQSLASQCGFSFLGNGGDPSSNLGRGVYETESSISK